MFRVNPIATNTGDGTYITYVVLNESEFHILSIDFILINIVDLLSEILPCVNDSFNIKRDHGRLLCSVV